MDHPSTIAGQQRDALEGRQGPLPVLRFGVPVEGGPDLLECIDRLDRCRRNWDQLRRRHWTVYIRPSHMLSQ